MSQYHAPANQSKGEALHGHRMSNLLELMSFGSAGYGGLLTGLALFIAPEGRWHGDQIVIVGDYAKPGQFPKGSPFASCPRDLYVCHRDPVATDAACALIEERYGITHSDTVEYGEFGEQVVDFRLLARLSSNTEDDLRYGPLYLVNRTTGEYVDPHGFGSGRNLDAIALRQCGPMQALSLLLAVSNGYGGGDFQTGKLEDQSLVPLIGSWGCQEVVIGPAPADGLDITTSIRRVMVESGEYEPEKTGSWDKPGSLPPFLIRRCQEIHWIRR